MSINQTLARHKEQVVLIGLGGGIIACLLTNLNDKLLDMISYKFVLIGIIGTAAYTFNKFYMHQQEKPLPPQYPRRPIPKTRPQPKEPTRIFEEFDKLGAPKK